MNECSNKKYRDMVHAYELGMLTETENEQFELHLLECPACREDILGFKEVAGNLNRSSETSQLIEELAQPESDDPQKADSKNRITRIWIPILTTAAIFIFLLIKPWDIQITPTKEALAEENRLAIMYFDNLADEQDSLKLGRIASNLLITDLAESQFINVLSNERIHDLIDFIAYEDFAKYNDSDKVIGDLEFKIARISNSKWILNGSILQINPNIVITSKLISYPAGDVLGSQKIVGEKGEDLFSVIDRLSVQIKNDLSLPSDAFNEPDRKISEFTTESQKAYYYYMEGIDHYLKYNTQKAIEYFDMAVEEDSTFAMAYYFLAATRDRNLIYKALEYSDNVSQLGKYYIEIFESSISGNKERNKYLLKALIKRYPDEKNAHLLLGRFAYNDNDFEKALEHFQIALDIDPIFKRAQNFLAYSYSGLNNYDSAITAINRYVELSPNEPNPYDSQGDIYARFGKLDLAIESYKRALDINPEFANSRLQLGLMHAFNGQYELADKTFDIIAYNPDNSLNVMVILSKAYIPIFQGAFDSSLTLMQIAIDSCNRVYPSFHFVRASVCFNTWSHWHVTIMLFL